MIVDEDSEQEGVTEIFLARGGGPALRQGWGIWQDVCVMSVCAQGAPRRGVLSARAGAGAQAGARAGAQAAHLLEVAVAVLPRELHALADVHE